MKNRLIHFFTAAGEKLKKQNWTRIALLVLMIWSVRHVNKEYWQTEDNWMEAVNGDGSGYYAYLPATFIYQDYSFRYLDSIQNQYRAQSATGNCGFCNITEGRTVNKYFCGEAVATAPFFLIADTITRATDYRRDGYSFLYMVFVSIGAIFYAFIGLYCTAKLLIRLGIHDYARALALCGIYLGTNLFHYTVWSSSFTHVYSFAFIALFALQVHSLCEKYHPRHLLLAAFTLGMIVILRPVNAIIVLSIPFLAGSGSSLKIFFTGIFRRFLYLIPAGLIFCGLIFIQLYLYKIQTGHWYVYAYGKEGFDFSNPHIFQALFSYNAGMLVYSPLLFLCFAGLAVLFYDQLFRALSFTLFIVAVLWVISSWWAWNYAGTYGMRPMVEYYSLLAILLAVFLNKLKGKRFFITALLLVVPLIIVAQVQTWQFRIGMISWDEMNEEKYWRVFMKTGKQYEYIHTLPAPKPAPETAKQIFHLKIDFEHIIGREDWRSVKSTDCYSGTKAVYLGRENYHPFIWKHRLSDYLPDSVLSRGNLYFEIRAKCKLESLNSNAKLVFNFQNKDGMYWYGDSYLIHTIKKENQWVDFRWAFSPPADLKADDYYEVYFTKTDSEIMSLDDMELIIWQW